MNSKVVEIIGTGRSIINYNHIEGAQIWGINLSSLALPHVDINWSMDDFRWCAAIPTEVGLIALMNEAKLPTMTSRIYPEYNCLKWEYPLQEILDNIPSKYHWFNHSPSYAFAYIRMMAERVKAYAEVHLHGFDYLGEFVRNNQYNNMQMWVPAMEEVGVRVRINPATKLMRNAYMEKFPEVHSWNVEDKWPLGGDFYGYYPQPEIKRSSTYLHHKKEEK